MQTRNARGGVKVMGEEVTFAEVSKQRITAQLKSAVKALQAAHVRDHTSVVYRLDVQSLQKSCHL